MNEGLCIMVQIALKYLSCLYKSLSSYQRKSDQGHVTEFTIFQEARCLPSSIYSPKCQYIASGIFFTLQFMCKTKKRIERQTK